MKKNILFICSHLPSLNVPQAGHKSAYSFLKNLSTENNIYLITFKNKFESKFYKEEDYNFCCGVDIINLSNIDKVINIIKNPNLPLRIATRKSKKVNSIIKRYCDNINFDTIHFEFTASMAYLENFNQEKIYLEVSQHDITYQSLFRKYKNSNIVNKLFYKFEFRRFKFWELNSLKKMNEIFLCNEKDKEILLKENFANEKLSVIKPYVNPQFKSINNNNVKRENTLIFWGAMNRVENEDAILWFLNDIYPKIRNCNKEIKLYIVGINPSKKVLKYHNGQDIIVTGFVDDPLVYFKEASLAIAPLRLGAGIKIKVLESLSSGLKVISTDVGAEGIEHNNLIIANTANSFANKILDNV